MADSLVRDLKWLEDHINNASAEVASWPAWKSQSSTLTSGSSPDKPAGRSSEEAKSFEASKNNMAK